MSPREKSNLAPISRDKVLFVSLCVDVCVCVGARVWNCLCTLARRVKLVENQAFHHAYWTWIHVWNPVSQAKRGSICRRAWWLNRCRSGHLWLRRSITRKDVCVPALFTSRRTWLPCDKSPLEICVYLSIVIHVWVRVCHLFFLQVLQLLAFSSALSHL